MKNPLPKPVLVSMRTTAGIARLITSSSAPVGASAAAGVVAGAAAAELPAACACARFDASAAAITRSSAVGCGASVGLGATAGVGVSADGSDGWMARTVAAGVPAAGGAPSGAAGRDASFTGLTALDVENRER